MHARHALPALALLAAAIGCADREAPLPLESPGAAHGPEAAAPALGAPGPEGQRLERQARRLARALGDAEFRQYVKAQLSGSPFAEHKLHFQRFLGRDGRRALAAMGRAEAEGDAAVQSDADAGITAELYFPVPGDLERWDGGPGLLVATALADHDAPIAYDTRGRRRVLSPDVPPNLPVLALVPNETDFDQPGKPARVICDITNCPDTGGGGTGSGSGGTGVPNTAPPVPALRLSRAQFVDTYEGWLKGNPEFELHVLGPASATDTTNMVSYQCVGEHAPSGYVWDMNATNWSGDVKVFGQDQMDAMERTYPGRAYVILALEDDDTACGIKTGADRFGDVFSALKSAYQSYVGIKDMKVITINGVVRIVGAAKSAASLINALASLIKSNDDLIGIAMADSIVGRTSPVGHWAVMQGKSQVNGWLNLEMK
jgi:hypothetical protein